MVVIYMYLNSVSFDMFYNSSRTDLSVPGGGTFLGGRSFSAHHTEREKETDSEEESETERENHVNLTMNKRLREAKADNKIHNEQIFTKHFTQKQAS
jgi:hypothetical protein